MLLKIEDFQLEDDISILSFFSNVLDLVGTFLLSFYIFKKPLRKLPQLLHGSLGLFFHLPVFIPQTAIFPFQSLNFPVQFDDLFRLIWNTSVRIN